MEINFNKKKLKNMKYEDYFDILAPTLSIPIIALLIISSFGFFVYSFTPEYRYHEQEINDINVIKYMVKVIPIISGIFLFLITLFIKFTIIRMKETCLICNKDAYPEEFILLNKTENKEGVMGRYVCKKHKKPYSISLKKDW